MPAGNVHEGMMEAATFVHCNAAAVLEKAGRQFQGWPLFVTGHSLGGVAHVGWQKTLKVMAACSVHQVYSHDGYAALLPTHAAGVHDSCSLESNTGT